MGRDRLFMKALMFIFFLFVFSSSLLAQDKRIKPDDAEAHFNLALVYLILGDRGSALDQYKILKELDKEQANQLFNLIYK